MCVCVCVYVYEEDRYAKVHMQTYILCELQFQQIIARVLYVDVGVCVHSHGACVCVCMRGCAVYACVVYECSCA